VKNFKSGVVILGIALIAVLSFVIIKWLPGGNMLLDRQLLLNWLQNYGRWAPILTITLHLLQVLAAPVPGTAIDAVNGLLFGPWLGTFYSMIGLLSGSWLLMWLARRLGRPLAERYISTDLLARLDGLVDRYGIVFIFLVFLIPFLPDDAICLLAGLTGIPLTVLMLLALLGRTPGVFVANWLGSQAGSFSTWQWGIAAVLLLVVILLVWHYRFTLPEKLLKFVENISERITGKRIDHKSSN
jgi:uncharacterized membrane protein YdjX (TVP38/TMEM64 family)